MRYYTQVRTKKKTNKNEPSLLEQSLLYSFIFDERVHFNVSLKTFNASLTSCELYFALIRLVGGFNFLA